MKLQNVIRGALQVHGPKDPAAEELTTVLYIYIYI